MCRSWPAIARALPIRPPFARYSSVSTVKSSRPRGGSAPTSASTSSSVVPRSSRRWIASASIAIAAEAVSESITRTRSPTSSAAVRALDRAGELAGDVEREDALVAGELLVDGEEVGGRRLRGGRQLGRRCAGAS